MSYYTGDVFGYRGDYYRGDYYRGDPGLFSFVGKALGGLARGAVNIAKGQLGLSSSSGRAMQLIPTFRATQTPPPIIRPFIPSGPGTLQPQPVFDGGAVDPRQPGMRRLHLNKSTYVTRGGGTSRWPQQLLVHLIRTELVPSRRMNVANPHALRRALRRVSGFAKIVKRSRRAISRAASAVGVRRGGGRKQQRSPGVRIVKAG